MICDYEIHPSKAQMVVKCIECQGTADLTDKACLRGILQNLQKEFRVNSLILSHYFEKQYGRDSIELLERMISLTRLMEQFSLREPNPLPSSKTKRTEILCEKCELNPQILFPNLRGIFLGSFEDLFPFFSSRAQQLYEKRELECSKCLEATSGDLLYLFNELQEFKKYVLYKGFKIIV